MLETQFKKDLTANEFKILEVLIDFLLESVQKMPMSALSPLCPSCDLKEAQLPLSSAKFLEIETWEYPYSFEKQF